MDLPPRLEAWFDAIAALYRYRDYLIEAFNKDKPMTVRERAACR